MGRRHFRRSLALLCLAAAVCAVLAVTVLVILRGDDLRRRYHFDKWKAIVLSGLVNSNAGEPQLSLSQENEAASWSHCLELADAEGYGFLMERVLEGGERDTVAASIALASLHGNVDRTRQPIALLVIAHEQDLRTRAERDVSPILRRVVRDLYTECRGGPKFRRRDVKRSKPAHTPQAARGD